MKVVFLIGLCWIDLFSMLHAQERPKVMVMEIKAEINPPMFRYVKLALEHADKIKADYVIIEMDTYGGVLTDAKEIVDLIMDFKKPIWVYINSDAASAGALISIACDSIYMSPGASIGAATVVEGTGGQAAPDKYQSYMRSIMRSTAEENGRDPRIAEGMVDEKVVIDSVKQAGKVITFTTSEASFGWLAQFADTILFRWNGGDSLQGKAAVTDYWKKRRTAVLDSLDYTNPVWLPMKVNNRKLQSIFS